MYLEGIQKAVQARARWWRRCRGSEWGFPAGQQSAPANIFLLLLSFFLGSFHLYMPIFGDGLEAVEICTHLWDVVDHRSDPEDCWMSAIVLHINKSQFQQMLKLTPPHEVVFVGRFILCFTFWNLYWIVESELHVSRIQSQSSLSCQDGFPIEN